MLLGASGQIGGAERVLLDCIRAGDGWPGAEMSVVTLGPGPLVSAANALGARTTVVEPPAAFSAVGDAFGSPVAVIRSMLPMLGRFPGFFRRFSSAIAGFVPHLIHSHGIKTHVLAALLPRRAPIVWHFHDYLGMRPVSSKLLRLLAHRCALAIAVSESVAQDARRRLPSGLAVMVVHNSTDGERFCPDGPALDLDSLAGLPAAAEGTIRIGLPATFARWKGQDTFLQAIALVGRADVRAYVVGAPVYETRNSQWSRDELSTMVKQLGLEGNVGFTGFVSDMPAVYRALDIVVHASTRPEPFGLAITEAMACGRAVVAAPAGGAGELFVHEEHALAAESGDAGALAAVLRTLIDDPQKRAALGRRARAHVVQAFGPERFAANLRAALSHVPGVAAEAAR